MKTGTSLKDLDFFEEPVNVALSQADIPWPCPQNRVIVTNFGTTFNHKQCVGMIPGSSFKNCRLSAYTARFYDPAHFMEPTGQGFTSGLYVSMGTNSARVSLLFIHIFRGIISNIPNLPKRPRNSPMFVCNKVSNGIYDPIDIHNFEKNDGTRVVRHRKSFSGIIYRRLIRFIPYSIKQVSISIFESGNYIVMNVEGMEALIAFIYFLPILQRNKLNKTAKPTANQIITFIRQAYIQFDPSKESIFDCVKNAMMAAEKAVITREQIIQKSIENVSNLKKIEFNTSSSSSFPFPSSSSSPPSSSIQLLPETIPSDSIKNLSDDDFIDEIDNNNDDVTVIDDVIDEEDFDCINSSNTSKKGTRYFQKESSDEDEEDKSSEEEEEDDAVLSDSSTEEILDTESEQCISSDDENEEKDIVIDDDEENDEEEDEIFDYILDSSIDHHNATPSIKPHFNQPIYIDEEYLSIDSSEEEEGEDKNKKRRV